GGTELNTNTLTADQTDTLYASSYDADSNWIDNVNADWIFDNDKGSFNGGVNSVSGVSNVTFNADVVTAPGDHAVVRATFGAHNDVTGTVAAGIEIAAGAQASVRINDAAGSGGAAKETNAMTADDNIVLYAAAYDADSNFIENPGADWSFTNDKGSFSGGGDVNTYNAKSTATFHADQITAPGDHAVLHILVGIHTDDTGVIGAGFEIVAGALASIRVESKSDGTGVAYSTGNVDNNVVAGTGMQLFAVGYDASSNYKGAISSTWTFDSTGNQASVIGNIVAGPATSTILTAASVVNADKIIADDGSGHVDNTGEVKVGVGAVSPNALTGVDYFELGKNMGCAVMTDDTVKCWGLGRESMNKGMLGVADDMTSMAVIPQIVQVDGGGNLTGVDKVALGFQFACALKTDGTVWCWGTSWPYKLGDGNFNADKGQAVQVKTDAVTALTDVTEIALGGYHACARLNTGEVRCWGEGANGRLANGGTADNQYAEYALSAVATNLVAVDNITAGNNHTCALMADTTVRCWGKGTDYALGNNNLADQLYADQQVLDDLGGNLTGSLTLRSGSYAKHTCASQNDGLVKCWGDGTSGKLGDGLSTDNEKATIVKTDAVTNLTGVVGIDVGSESTCAVLKGSGKIICWGNGTAGNFGNNSTGGSNYADKYAFKSDGSTVLTRASKVQASDGFDYFTCALFPPDGFLKCWGASRYGTLGSIRDSSNDKYGFMEVQGSDPGITYEDISAAEVAVGKFFICIRTPAGKASCWGRGEWGTIGNNLNPVLHTLPATTASFAFVEDSVGVDLTNVAQIVAGDKHACARFTDNTVKCWGDNSQNQLGDNTTISRNHAVTVWANAGSTIPVNDAVWISTEDNHTCIVTTGGNAKCWGDGANGALGDGSTVDNPFAEFVKSDVVTNISTVDKISVGDKNTCVLYTDDTASCWGATGNGVNGDDNVASNNYADTKVLASTGPNVDMTNISQIEIHNSHAVAMLIDGTVRVWGSNVNTQKGLGTTNPRAIADEAMRVDAVPTYFGTATYVALGLFSTCVIDDISQVFCAGTGLRYQMGDNASGTNQYLNMTVLKGDLNPIDDAIQVDSNVYVSCAVSATNALRCWGFGVDHIFQVGSRSVFKSYMVGEIMQRRAP
ncbi:MAG: hypothetical protein HOE90_07900, partial [Bacteriovoracaceae bacterium]|nr:hypothetical protein [Bacteriovoracaceae bacterium]